MIDIITAFIEKDDEEEDEDEIEFGVKKMMEDVKKCKNLFPHDYGWKINIHSSTEEVRKEDRTITRR